MWVVLFVFIDTRHTLIQRRQHIAMKCNVLSSFIYKNDYSRILFMFIRFFVLAVIFIYAVLQHVIIN